MFEAYLPLAVVLVVASAVAAGMLFLSSRLGPKRPDAVKSAAFECGNPSSGSARYRVGVHFFLVAILFLVFDIEAVFIYPWAVVFSGITKGTLSVPGLSPLVVVLEMVAFAGVIVVGLTYAWRKGALEWGPRHSASADR